MRILAAIGVGLCLTLAACEQTPTDPATRAQYLGEQIRCPICRGVSIADSPAELAKNMMQRIHQQIAEGKTDVEILQGFEERYGEWALLKPKSHGAALVVWILPALFLIGGAAGIVYRLRAQRQPYEE